MKALWSLLCFLVACASPAPVMFGAARHDLTLEGIRFVVFHKGAQAEVIRLGYLSMRARERVPALMVVAAEQATGCRVTGPPVTGVPGDTGEAKFRLRC